MDLSHLLCIKCIFLHKTLNANSSHSKLCIGLKFSRMNLKFTAHDQIRTREEEESCLPQFFSKSHNHQATKPHLKFLRCQIYNFCSWQPGNRGPQILTPKNFDTTSTSLVTRNTDNKGSVQCLSYTTHQINNNILIALLAHLKLL